MPSLDERYHYHHGLKAGANLVRVLMRSIIKNEGYEQSEFLSDFIEYMTDVDANNDPYLEIYIRDWFENYSKGVAPELCAPSQRDRWSIGSHGGIIRPLVLSLTAKNSFEGLGIGISHQQLTHRSETVSSALGKLVPLLENLLSKDDSLSLLTESAKEVALIKIHGKDLSKRYFEAHGPGNIPKDQMWKIHTEYSDEFLSEILSDATDESMITNRFATACYPEHGVPLIYYFLYKNKFDFTSSLLDNANAGGDNVHRGMVMGLLVGAANKEIPESLKIGLKNYTKINNEIEDFVKLCK
ncbi:protein containing ADP-ribosylation/Crystallin J1 domain [Sulfurimonas gotlandica GD1]|uniref:Protein containing ADP-ribosylation/Crystallin J1 domain n=1 Tax=Sulfurimonas gotlandica (strain DSM 19862 / JCM 16533 / GD1) TaxID=929558 RepID=B6BJW5_SULGG|nr:ADP-ribosylglycohydrolase family protein [Sulfurimonas gotlandica]EDZ62516.1 conserved hypothetical protein [Sulfurimonas gotlandica GD1]EHP31366.1 protein containing ADP-ribosylation/Crystallin J1 domain [Sulfurimonas gotlandica GD1]